MACRLFGAKPLPEPIIVNQILRNTFQWKRNSNISIHENAFENGDWQNGVHFVQGEGWVKRILSYYFTFNKQNQHEDAMAWKHFRPFVCMMTSSNGNIFRVTGPLSVTRSFDVYFDLRPNKRLSKQSWGWWFETLSWSLWRHHNGEKSTSRCKRPITRSFRVFFDVNLNELLNKQLTWFTEPFNQSLCIQVIFAIARVRSFVRQGFPTIILISIHPMIIPFKFGIYVHIHYLGEFSEIIHFWGAYWFIQCWPSGGQKWKLLKFEFTDRYPKNLSPVLFKLVGIYLSDKSSEMIWFYVHHGMIILIND